MTVDGRARPAALSVLRTLTNARANGSSSMVGRVVAPTMVGRAAELELLATTVAAPPAVAVIDGEAGIGKTRLISELAGRLELSGCRLVVGGCRRIREPFPLGPVIEAVRGLGEELAGVRFSPVVGALRPLLPELASWLPLAPESLGDRAAERHRVFRALVELLGAIGPAVVVLEDLHWADEQTVEFLGYLLAGEPAQLSVVLTFRGEEVDPGVRAVTARMPASVGYAAVALGPLDVEQTGTLAASILDTERISADLSAHLCVRASGVPLAVEELVALLRARGTLIRAGGTWARKAIDELDVPAGIRDPVLERVNTMSEDGRQMIEAAAVLQEPVPVSVLAQVSQVGPTEGSRGVEEALTSGLLIEQDDVIGFRHVLAAQAVYGAMTGPRVQYLHGRAAAVLEQRDPVPLGQLSHHLRHAGRLAEYAKIAERAADQAVELGHDTEAARLLADILRNAALPHDERGRLAVKLGRAAHQTFHSSEELIDTLSETLNLDLPRPVRGELAFWLSTAVQDAGGDPALKRRLLLEAVENLDGVPHLQAWAMVGLGIATHPGVPKAEHKRWLDRVLDIMPEVDDSAFEVFLLGKVAMTLAWIGDSDWRPLTSRVVRRTAGRPRHRHEINAFHSIGLSACYSGHHRAGERLLNRSLDGAIACENRAVELMVRSALVLRDCICGAWEGLGSRVAELRDELADVPVWRVDVDVAAGMLEVAHGDIEVARNRLTRAAEQLEAEGKTELLPLAVSVLARLAVICGESDDAVARVDRLLGTLRSKGLSAPVTRVLPAATQVLITVGREPDARALVTDCAGELADLDMPLAPAAMRHAYGFLATDEERSSAAAEHFLAAADLYEPLQCPYEAAQAREQAAVALWKASDDRFEQTLCAALASYQQLGASWDAARCVRVARTHGLRVPVPHRGGRIGYGDELSPREEEVAKWAAEGLSNKEIGAAMFLSPKTVDKHLGRAMRKLGVHSRAAVAARLSTLQGASRTRG